eukprot:sb/3466741/
MDFRSDVTMSLIRNTIFYYLMRLDLGCSENLIIDFKFSSGPPFLKSPNADIPRWNNHPVGQVYIKECWHCNACRIQTTKPRPITIQGHEMTVRLAVRKCYGVSVKCADRAMANSFTVLGPASLPVNYTTDTDFQKMSDRFLKSWKGPSPGHLILVFECPLTYATLHRIMGALRESCVQAFTKVAPVLRSSLKRIIAKTSTPHTTVELASAAHSLAVDIADVVLESEHEEFKKTVVKLLPSAFHSKLLAGTIQDVGARNGLVTSQRSNVTSSNVTSSNVTSSSSSCPPPSKKARIMEERIRVARRVFSQNLVDEWGVPSGPLERYR